MSGLTDRRSAFMWALGWWFVRRVGAAPYGARRRRHGGRRVATPAGDRRGGLGAFVLVAALAAAFVAWRRLAGGSDDEGWEPPERAPPAGTGADPGGRRGVTIAGPGPELFRPALEGLVPYEPGKPAELVQRELGLDRVVKLASNEGPFGPFPQALVAIEESLGRVQPLPGRRCVPPARRARRAPRRRLRGDRCRGRRRRGDRLRLPGDARPR